jgi:hypothetical protein
VCYRCATRAPWFSTLHFRCKQSHAKPLIECLPVFDSDRLRDSADRDSEPVHEPQLA